MVTGALLNQGGDTGTGGLDLDEGISTGTTTGNFELAEIEDEGINLNLSADENWRRQISSINGTEIRTPDFSALPETFSFENVNSKAEIEAAFEGGLALMGSDDIPLNATTDNEAGEEVSEPVEEGDIFLVKRDDRYYIIIAREVVTTDNNNEDFYSFDIKY